MRKILPIIFVFFCFSCGLWNDKLNSIENQTDFTQTINVVRKTDYETKVLNTFEIKPKETYFYERVQWDTVFELKSSARGKLTKESSYTYIIESVQKLEEKINIINMLPFDIILKDSLCDEWETEVSAGESLETKVYRYSDETHNFYVKGSVYENGIYYIDLGSQKIIITGTFIGNTIIIKSI